MGLYADHILPRAVAWGMSGEEYGRQRAQALAGVSGRVLELGFGAGHNLPHYPDAVSEVLALEPAEVNRKLARKRVQACPMPVTWVGLRGEEIPLDAASVDAVTSTWTLCTIPDPARALAEVRRVLRPSGAFHFLEHGLSSEPRVARWQRRLTPIHRRIAGGCHLDREIDEMIAQAGFQLERLDHPYMKGPQVIFYLYRGEALLDGP